LTIRTVIYSKNSIPAKFPSPLMGEGVGGGEDKIF